MMERLIKIVKEHPKMEPEEAFRSICFELRVGSMLWNV